jgi:HEAT repeat protein
MPLIKNKLDNSVSEGIAAKAPDLASASLDERFAAARACGDIPASVPALAQALAREKEPLVREAIFTALARIGSQASVEAVLPHLRSEDANIRTGALDALRAMPRTVEPLLPLLLSDPDADVRILACDLVRNMSGDEAPQRLHTLLETEGEPNVCASAVEVLAEIGDAKALPALTQCAARFPDDPFLGFAIEVAVERLRAQNREFP